MAVYGCPVPGCSALRTSLCTRAATRRSDSSRPKATVARACTCPRQGAPGRARGRAKDGSWAGEPHLNAGSIGVCQKHVIPRKLPGLVR